MFVCYLGLLEAVREGARYRAIVLAMGWPGVISRVAGTYMHPVTHADLPTAAAPGQLTVATLRRLQLELGFIMPRYVASYDVKDMVPLYAFCICTQECVLIWKSNRRLSVASNSQRSIHALLIATSVSFA